MCTSHFNTHTHTFKYIIKYQKTVSLIRSCVKICNELQLLQYFKRQTKFIEIIILVMVMFQLPS